MIRQQVSRLAVLTDVGDKNNIDGFSRVLIINHHYQDEYHTGM